MIEDPWSLWLPKLKRVVASHTATSELCFKNLRALSLEVLDLSSSKVKKLKVKTRYVLLTINMDRLTMETFPTPG